MELKIYSPQDAGFVQKIDWNFEELKSEIIAVSQEYETSVYTDEAMKNAKSDRAKLRRFVDAMKSERAAIRKKLLEPDILFGEQISELTGIVERAIDNIDSQVKDYEQRQRDAKTEKIREFYEENIQDLAEYLPFERLFRSEWANVSTTMKSVKESMMDTIQKVAEGLAILNEVESPYAGDMKKVFLRTYDIGAAMAERNRLEAEEENRRLYMEEQEQRKAEREAARRAETERVMAAGRNQQAEPEQVTSHTALVEDVAKEPVHILDFRVHATMDQLNQLKNFLKTAGIRFEPVPKN